MISGATPIAAAGSRRVDFDPGATIGRGNGGNPLLRRRLP